MKAALCKQFGGPEVVVVEDIPEPEPGPGEVLIKVNAAALNFFDTLAIRDKYQFKPEPPFSPGAEVAGVIEALGEGVTGFERGMRVAASVQFNGCREKTLAGADGLVAIPDTVSDAVASGDHGRSITVEVRRILLALPFGPVAGSDRLAAVFCTHASAVLGEAVPAHGVPLYADARHYAAAGVPTVMYGAGPRTLLEANAHRADERVHMDQLLAATKVVALSLADLLG